MRLGVSAALVGGRLVAGDVAVRDGRISAVGLGGGGRGVAAPGFVDLHVNGFAGVDFLTTGRDGYERAGAALLASGVTAFQPTFVSAPEATLVAALREVPAEPRGHGGVSPRSTGAASPRGGPAHARGAASSSAAPRVLGAHLEGPFLARAGAHDPRALRAPDLALLRRLLDAGPVTQVTLAPELDGALELVDELVRRGVTAAAGHTNADAAAAHAAFDRGVRTVAHLFNAMALGTAREPGLVLAALGRPDVTVQMIGDLVHVAPDALLAAWRAAAGRFALVTDAAAPAGATDGEFVLGGRPVRAAGGVVRGADGGLAGSALTMIAGVRNLVSLGIPLEDALAAASRVPARIAGRPDLGTLEPGAAADVVVLDDRLEVARVVVNGVAGA
ncbi:MAG TPA: amidohydrolase family protein [Solirubrobacter sp.]|nr:amidohydrolase family protein [Solirubrobacter sp.]